jgi:hypothetical protein
LCLFPLKKGVKNEKNCYGMLLFLYNVWTAEG